MPFLPLLVAATMAGPDTAQYSEATTPASVSSSPAPSSASPAPMVPSTSSTPAPTTIVPVNATAPTTTWAKVEPQEIGSVVTTADRHAEPLANTVKPTFVVTRKQIEDYGYDTVAEAIQAVPGEQLLQYGAFGSGATYHQMGSASNGTTILLDGVPIATGSDGNIDIGAFSTNGVQRIEIVESGGSVLYGSGGAGGVINIITSLPRSAYLAASYGSFGDREIRVADGNGVVGVSFERHVATNDYPYAAQAGEPGGVRYNDDAEQTDTQVTFLKKLGQYSVHAMTDLSQMNSGTPGSLAYPTSSDRTGYSRNEFLTDISRVDGNYTSSVTLSQSHQNGIFNTVSFGGQSALSDQRTGISLKEVIAEHGTNNLVAGIDLQRESAFYNLGVTGDPNQASEFTGNQTQSAIYAQQTLGLGPTGKVYAGLRAEHDSPAGSVLDPGAGIRVPVGKMQVASNISETFIVPTLLDLYYPGSSNNALLPERDRNIDFDLSLPGKRITPSLLVFDRTASNLIAFVINDQNNFYPINAGSGHFQGATFTVSTKVLHGFDTSFNITDLWNATEFNQGVASRLDYEPQVYGSASLEHALGASRFSYGTTLHFSGGHTESYTGPGEYGSYATDDLYVRYHLVNHSVISFQEKNLGNNTNGFYGSYPVPGHQYRIEYSTR